VYVGVRRYARAWGKTDDTFVEIVRVVSGTAALIALSNVATTTGRYAKPGAPPLCSPIPFQDHNSRQSIRATLECEMSI
jgi:hypothetical protein